MLNWTAVLETNCVRNSLGLSLTKLSDPTSNENNVQKSLIRSPTRQNTPQITSLLYHLKDNFVQQKRYVYNNSGGGRGTLGVYPSRIRKSLKAFGLEPICLLFVCYIHYLPGVVNCQFNIYTSHSLQNIIFCTNNQFGRSILNFTKIGKCWKIWVLLAVLGYDI